MTLRTLLALVACSLGAGLLTSVVSAARAAAPATSLSTTTRVEVSLPEQPLDSYLAIATDVVRGRVVAKREVYRDSEMDFTAVAIRVEDTLKGDSSGTIEIGVPGATRHPNRRTLVRAAPMFEIGDHALFFLWRDAPEATPGVLGLAHGVYRITDEESGTTVRGLHAEGLPYAAFEARVRAGLDTTVERGGRR